MVREYQRTYRHVRNGKNFMPYQNYAKEDLEKAIFDVKANISAALVGEMTSSGKMTRVVEKRSRNERSGIGELSRVRKNMSVGEISFDNKKKKCGNVQRNVADGKKELRNTPRKPSDRPPKLEKKQTGLDKRTQRNVYIIVSKPLSTAYTKIVTCELCVTSNKTGFCYFS